MLQRALLTPFLNEWRLSGFSIGSLNGFNGR